MKTTKQNQPPPLQKKKQKQTNNRKKTQKKTSGTFSIHMTCGDNEVLTIKIRRKNIKQERSKHDPF